MCRIKQIAGRVLPLVLLSLSSFCVPSAKASEYPLRDDGGGLFGEVKRIQTRYEDTLIQLARQHSLGYEELLRVKLGSKAGKAASRITAEGVLVIKAQSHRTQDMNRLDAYARLQDLVQSVALPPKPRRATRPTRASKERRLQAKSQRSAIKELRGKALD